MPTNYDNCVCQVKAKTANGEATKGFCDIQQVEVPLFMCLTSSLSGANGDDATCQIRDNVYDGETLMTAYNAIPANTARFCMEYFTRFKKYPNCHAFLYNLTDAPQNKKNDDEPRKPYKSPYEFVTGSLSASYGMNKIMNSDFGVTSGNKTFKDFLEATGETTYTFPITYGVDGEQSSSFFRLSDVGFVLSFSEGGTQTYYVSCKKEGETDTYISIPQSEFDDTHNAGINLDDGWTKIFTFKLNKEDGKYDSFTIKKDVTEPSLQGTIMSYFDDIEYTNREHQNLQSLSINDDIVIKSDVRLNSSEPRGVRVASKTYVTPDIRFTFDGEGSSMNITQQRANITWVEQEISPSSNSSNESSSGYNFSIEELLGDAVLYTQNTSNGGGGSSTRTSTTPIFYLDPELNLPEFWNTTDETTL